MNDEKCFYQIQIFLNRGELNKYLVSYKDTDRLSDSEKKKKKQLFKLKKLDSCNTIIGGFPGGSVVKNLPTNAGDVSLIPELGRTPGEGNDNPLQYSCLEVPWTEEPGRLQSKGMQKSWTLLSDSTIIQSQEI